MPDIVAPKAHPNNRRYVSSADLPLDSLCKNLVWWAVFTENLENHKTVKVGRWVLVRGNTIAAMPMDCSV